MQASGPVLVDFWADWCGPCKLMHPLMAQLQDEFGDSLKVVKVDCDQNPDAVEKYEVRSCFHTLPCSGAYVPHPAFLFRCGTDRHSTLDLASGARPSGTVCVQLVM